MGKRKSRAKAPPKKRIEKLDTVFTCPFCSHDGSVICEIDKKEMIGILTCTICSENFSTTITTLTEPIDIYSEWIDECERVNNLEYEDEDEGEGEVLKRGRTVYVEESDVRSNSY